MITKEQLDALRLELSVKSKNGIDFIFAASVIWFLVAIIWTLDYSSYNKSVFTFCVGGLLMPLALLFSKLFKTTWTNKENPLQPLGIWLNVAQVFYFPFLIFTLIKMPDYFVMVYAIITGAHFLPYAWFYNTKWYALAAGFVSLGSLFLGLTLSSLNMFYIPLLLTITLIILGLFLFFDSKRKALSSTYPK